MKVRRPLHWRKSVGALAAAVVGVGVLAVQAGAQVIFQVSVQPQVVARTGDTVAVTYTVHVVPPSNDSLVGFYVEAPSGVLVDSPSPAAQWMVGNRFRRKPVATWATLDRFWGAGDSTPPLPMKARGLLAVVHFWAQRAKGTDSLVTVSPADLDTAATPGDTSIDVPSVQGSTIGVVDFPADVSAGGLANRLSALVDQVCALGWIDNHGICNSLSVKVKAQAGPLGALLNELNAQRGKHVSEAAYQLLTFNAQFLLARL